MSRPRVARVADQVTEGQRALVVHQHVVHLPERALRGGGLGRLGGQLRVLVDVGQRQVPEDEAQLAELADQLADGGLGLPAVGALEVAVLDQGDQRVLFGPRMWSRSGSTGTARSVTVAAVPSSARSRVRGESRFSPPKTPQVSSVAHDRAGQDAELGLGQLRCR